jgi:predicted RND superfamily exporter protein
LVTKYATTLTLLSFLVGGVSLFYTVELYRNLRTDLEELLPTTARSVLDLEEVASRLQGIDSLALVITSQNVKRSKDFVLDFVREAKKLPPDVVANIEYEISRELEFFRKRKLLYMDLKDLVSVRDYIRDRIRYEKTLYNPLTVFQEEEIPEPQLDLRSFRKKYESRLSTYTKFPDGFYALPDGTRRIVLLDKPGKTSGIASVKRLKSEVAAIVARLHPSSYAPDLQVNYTGGVQDTLEEQEALVADLGLSTVIVLFIVTLSLWWFFRGFSISLALFTSLMIGTFATFGLSYFVVGYLNANSAFLGAIVLGNGINFGIILLARYVEECQQGKSHEDAIHISISRTAVSTWVAALAAGLSYGSLALTSFRGFAQFGVIGLMGMVLCWLATFITLPSILTVLNRRTQLVKPLAGDRNSKNRGIWAAVSRFIEGRAWILSLLTIGLAVWASYYSLKASSEVLENDLSKLRNRESLISGSGFYSKQVDEVFERYLTPIALLPRSRESTSVLAEALRKKREQEGAQSLIAGVSSLEDFLPAQMSEKLEVISEIRKLLPPKFYYRMGVGERTLFDEYLTPEVRQGFTEEDLPELVRRKFTERDGSRGKLVLVEPPLDGLTWNGPRLVAFIQELREVADAIAPGTPVAGSLPISADMLSSISKDGPRATLFAFLAVAFLVILIFRKPRIFLPVLLGLLLGVLWLFGLIFGLELKINFLNFIALPLTFGIGVDYGVNVFQRYREEGPESLTKVISETGGAVALCSWTTTVGYGSLLIAGNQAFVSFGLLSVLGEVTCLLAALVSLPALLLTRSQWKARRRS